MSFSSNGGVGGHLGVGRFGKPIQVATVRLAELLGSQVDLLKLDIEGAECDVLLDCEPRLRNISHLFVEFHGDPNAPQRLHELLRLISGCGFRYYLKDARGDARPLDFEWRWQTYDYQANIFAIRE
jgi:hypothetical protein